VSVVVLSARPETATNLRLAEAADELGVDLGVIDALELSADSCGRLLRRGETVPVSAPCVVLARVGNWRPGCVVAILEAITVGAAEAVNPAESVRIGRDHWRTVRVLEDAGIAVPLTIAGADPEALARDAAARLRFPVVVKQRRSRMGVGVIRCVAPDHLEAVLDSLWRVGDEVVVQEYVETGGSSLRLLVSGDRVVAAARFTAAAGEWRSNAARGGDVCGVAIDEPTAELAVGAARAAGLGLCGVDLLPSPDRVLVGELNPSPGVVALERATGVDVASAIVSDLAGFDDRATRRC
jgi:RimK family alpha-L-glutamate ligase